MWGAALLLLIGSAGAEQKLNVLALFEDKALLHVDGQRVMLAVGETSPGGVTLLEADSERAVVLVDGAREELYLGVVVNFPDSGPVEAVPAWEGPQSVSLWADSNGFFYAGGSINGFPVRFLVDTGATTVAISGDLASRIGVDLSQGQRGIATTASGVTGMVRVTLPSVTVGELTLRDVEAGVLMGSFPTEPLLGMSFLGQLDMVREGDRMDLKRRF
jgi:aspartyl protease family protein